MPAAAAPHSNQEIRAALTGRGQDSPADWTLHAAEPYVLIAATDLMEGMRLDLQSEHLPGSDDVYEFEYGEVHEIEHGDNATVVVHTQISSVAFPASHELRVVADSLPDPS
jgi:hypothetical protein